MTKKGDRDGIILMKEYVYGFKIHVIVDTKSELLLALSVTKTNVHDSTQFSPLYTTVKSYDFWFLIRFFTADKACDSTDIGRTLINDDVTPIIKASKTQIKLQYPNGLRGSMQTDY